MERLKGDASMLCHGVALSGPVKHGVPVLQVASAHGPMMAPPGPHPPRAHPHSSHNFRGTEKILPC
jgi:hypothetical protein